MADVKADVSKRLDIQDIALWETSLKRNVEYPDVEPASIRFQEMRGVRVDNVEAYDDEGSLVELLKMFVSLGVRCRAVRASSEDVHSVEGDSDSSVLFTLEATFAVDYLVKDSLSQDEVTAFARFNAVHNVWPFWRQHVFDVLKKASLPIPEVPFFAGRTVMVEE